MIVRLSVVKSTAIGKSITVVALCIVWSVAVGQARDLAASGHVPPPNDRFHVEEQTRVRVTSAVPSAGETLRIFDFGLYARNIQPVWVQVENLTDVDLWFLPIGVDEAYFTPIETSYRRQNRIPFLDSAINRDYYSMRMSIRIRPRETRSGYVFTRVDQGTKSFNVDVDTSCDSTRCRARRSRRMPVDVILKVDVKPSRTLEFNP